MLLLSSTSAVLRLVTSSAAAIKVHASWVDLNGTTVTPDSDNTSIAGAGTNNVVGSPGASTQRNTKLLTIRNDDASLACDVTLEHYDGTVAAPLWEGTLQPSEMVIWTEGIGFTRLNSGGTVVEAAAGGPVDLQVFTTPGAATWTKPTSFTPKAVRVVVYGGGGGGGGGASQTGAVVRTGGTGGGGGARDEGIFDAADLPSTVAVTVGAGGTGGAGGASGTDGAVGNAGGLSEFGTGNEQWAVRAYGGGGGAAGDNAASAASGGSGGGQRGVGVVGQATGQTGGVGALAAYDQGAASLNTAAGPNPSVFGGGAGGGHTNVPANAPGGPSVRGGCGGGCGGGATVAPAVVNAQGGGLYTMGGGAGSGLGGTAGTSGAAPTAGGTGQTGNATRGGGGGGGGGATITVNTNGGNGGAGGFPAGGGGGGGVGSNTGSGGNGGAGANGAVYVFTW